MAKKSLGPVRIVCGRVGYPCLSKTFRKRGWLGIFGSPSAEKAAQLPENATDFHWSSRRKAAPFFSPKGRPCKRPSSAFPGVQRAVCGDPQDRFWQSPGHFGAPGIPPPRAALLGGPAGLPPRDNVQGLPGWGACHIETTKISVLVV